MASPSVSEASQPARSLPPRPAHLARRRAIGILVALALLAGGGEAIGIPKILGWRFASQAHARQLEQAVTGARPTNQTTPNALINQLLGGITPGDQEPVTIDAGKLSTPTRIDTVMANAATLLANRGYTRRDVSSEWAMTDPGAWNCRFDAPPSAPAATFMLCYVSAQRAHEHVQIGVVTTVPPQNSGPAGRSIGPDPNIASLLVTNVQVTVKD